jgi:hypothetical protein
MEHPYIPIRHRLYSRRRYQNNTSYQNNTRYESLSNLDFSDFIHLSLERSNTFQEPLFNFTSIIKKNAAKKILHWYRLIVSKRTELVGR